MIDTERSKTTVTHTETSLNGSVVAIMDVPAYTFEEDGEYRTIYDMNVALKIDDFVANIFEGEVEPNSLFSYSYQYLEAGLYADAKIKFVGSNLVNFGSATTKVWKDSVDGVHNCISILQHALESVFDKTAIKYPVLIPQPGSLLFNLYTKEPSTTVQEPVFEMPQPWEARVLKLLMDSYSYAIDDNTSNPLIKEYPQLRIATARAIETLSPKKSSEIAEVQILPFGKILKEYKPITLTNTTREIAKAKRTWLEAGSEASDIRDVVLIGQIAQLTRDSKFTITDIEYNYPDGKKYPTRALYYPQIFKELGRLFLEKKRVVFRGIEYRRNGKWTSEPNIKSVEEYTGEAPQDGEPLQVA